MFLKDEGGKMSDESVRSLDFPFLIGHFSFAIASIHQSDP
jgi:hypothetical protein